MGLLDSFKSKSSLIKSLHDAEHDLQKSRQMLDEALLQISSVEDRISEHEYYTNHNVSSLIGSGTRPSEIAPAVTEKIILVCDINKFSYITEYLAPQEIIGFLNSFYSEINPLIVANGGMIDSINGDSVQANFERIEDACLTAIEIRENIQRLNRSRIIANMMKLECGIGLSSGKVICANVGSKHSMSYTVVGDAVRTARKIEERTKEYGCSILMTAEIAAALQNGSHVRFVDTVQLHGGKAEDLYELYGYEPEDIITMKTDLAAQLSDAWRFYQDADFEKASACYADLLEKAGRHKYNPLLCADPLVEFYLRRSNKYLSYVSRKMFNHAKWKKLFENKSERRTTER